MEQQDCAILDTKLTFAAHISYTISKSKKIIRLLYSLINRNSKLLPEQKLLIYKCIILPVLLYASPCWGKCAKTHLNQIQIQQNSRLKMAMNKPRFCKTSEIHYLTQVNLIRENIKNIDARFYDRCSASDNPLVLEIINQLH